MPTVIKNIHLIDPILAPGNREKLEAGAMLHKRHANLVFKVEIIKTNELVVNATQQKNIAGNYLSAQDIVSRTKDMFAPFLPSTIVVHINAVPYVDHPISRITGAWVNSQMKEHHIKAKRISDDTGIDYNQIVNAINGTKPMSSLTKAMFYYYFQYKTTAGKSVGVKKTLSGTNIVVHTGGEEL